MTWADVSLCIDTGADAAGMIFAQSPRHIDWNSAAEIAQRIGTSILPVGVFVNPTLDEVERARWLFPELVVQLSGEESPEFARKVGGSVVKTMHVASNDRGEDLERRTALYDGAIVLFDTKVAGEFGGTGRSFDWSKIAKIARTRPIAVAGGLTPENVADCIRNIHPAWVDVRTGIETGGRKDAQKMERFVASVRAADAS